MRLKDICQLNPAYLGGNIEDTVSFVPMESLRNGNIDLKEISFSEAKGKYTYFADGDLLIAKVTPCFENGNIAVAENLKNGIGFGSSEIFVLRMNKDSLNKYVFYLSQTSHFQDSACATMCGVGGLKRISPLFFRTYEFNIPSLAEQQRIVNYLDKKLSAIDLRVEVLEKEKDTYARLKKSVINQAVTRGLNPNAALKDSGIDWIGMIPEHWNVRRIKEIADLNSGTTPSTKNDNYYNRGIHPWINTGCVQDCEIYEPADYVTDLAMKECKGLKYIPEDSILLAMYGGGTIGNVGILKFSATINQACCAITLDKKIADVRYIFYYLLSIKKWMISRGFGGTQINLSQGQISNFCVSLPPLSEQQAIAAYLDEKCAKIDAAIENIRKQIDASKRLKKAIINEAISGKLFD